MIVDLYLLNLPTAPLPTCQLTFFKWEKSVVTDANFELHEVFRNVSLNQKKLSINVLQTQSLYNQNGKNKDKKTPKMQQGTLQELATLLNQSFPAMAHKQDETIPNVQCLKKKADYAISWFMPSKSQERQNSMGAPEKYNKKQFRIIYIVIRE